MGAVCATCHHIKGVATQLLADRHRENIMGISEDIKIFLYSKAWSKKIIFSDESKEEFDAFISFSHKDDSFVYDTLLPGLETDHKQDHKQVQYKCLIHTRDWEVGDFICDQIYTSVKNSRRTIILLSADYIKSTWAHLEFHLAHAKAMQEKNPHLILLIHSENEPEKAKMRDKVLKKYLYHKCFIKTNDPDFWTKLRDALPKKKCEVKK